MILYNRKPNAPKAAAGGQIPGEPYNATMQRLMSTGIDPYKAAGGTMPQPSYGRAKAYESQDAINARLEKPGMDHVNQGDLLSMKTNSPLDQAFNNINQYNNKLDVALMNKYPGVDFDEIKRQAVPLTNDKVGDFVNKGGYTDYNLSQEEMQAALGDDYNTYNDYNSRIKQATRMNTKGKYDLQGKVAPERYGLRNSLFKYNVTDKKTPYRFRKDLMG